MASVTQTQRDKLAALFNKKLNKVEQAIRANKGTEFKILDEQAKSQAVESLGIVELYAECLEKLEAITLYRERVRVLHEKMDELLSKPKDYFPRHYGHRVEDSLSAYAQEQVGLRQQYHRRLLLADTPYGAKLNQIEELRENMEEQVMRATSSKEIQAVMDGFDQVFKELTQV